MSPVQPLMTADSRSIEELYDITLENIKNTMAVGHLLIGLVMNMHLKALLNMGLVQINSNFLLI